MRKIGDILFVTFSNKYHGQKCRIIGVNKVSGDTMYNIELLEPQFNWKTGHNDLKFTFSNVHYCYFERKCVVHNMRKGGVNE